MTTTLSVSGMRCGKCVDKIEKFIGEIEGISLIDVNLEKSQVRVEFNAPATQELISEAILEAGFEIDENNS
ncbi:copper ion binding protein [Helicobacter sp. MIT 21-1697]|uniref:copper ion binding protein n=1 Tax=Helicobacter sp. MIT 21-1697 TaxID=2993733 RepID=UPI00224AE1FB|nr:copper ion binding protein [Helicobacter sp. MIT 21-1697]MCX2716178.1 copper ion binding protein [Helicobacter sp. MIT 21-1697]